MALFFPSSSSPSSFPWMRRDASCHYDISNLAGKTKKREKKATDRWRPGGWHSNVPPCLRRSTKDAGASEGNWKMTRRERERGTGTSLKGSTSGTNRWSRRRVEGDVRKDREREKEEKLGCLREGEGKSWKKVEKKERERERWAAARWQNGEGKDEGKRGAVEQEGYA